MIMPVNTGVLIKFYDENPYKAVEKTSSGLIIGMESTQKYKSNETGEMEENFQFVACAKVIEVGPKCENVLRGEDIYVPRSICNPIPFMKQGYYIISEQNIFCRVKQVQGDNSGTEKVIGWKPASMNLEDYEKYLNNKNE